MIGRPSAVVPLAVHVPEQHSVPDSQISLIGRQPPRNVQVATPEPSSTQALEQHELEMPGLPQGSPTTPQDPTDAQLPTVAPAGLSQYWLQQSMSALHSSPWARQLVTMRQRQPTSVVESQASPPVSAQKSEQHWLLLVQASPIGSQFALDAAQVVPLQLYEQQSASTEQPSASTWHAPLAGPQVVPAQFSEQQSLSIVHGPVSPVHRPVTQTIAPSTERHWLPAQHSADAVHGSPDAVQPPAVTQTLPAHRPLQQSAGPVHAPSTGTQAASIVPGGASIVPGGASIGVSSSPLPPPPQATRIDTAKTTTRLQTTANARRWATMHLPKVFIVIVRQRRAGCRCRHRRRRILTATSPAEADGPAGRIEPCRPKCAAARAAVAGSASSPGSPSTSCCRR